MEQRLVSSQTAAAVALAGFTWWILAVILAHALAPDHYQPAEQPVSELVHEPYGLLVNSALIAIGIGGLALAFGLWRAFQPSRLPAILLGLAAVLWLISGVFNTGEPGMRALEGDPAGTSAIIHDAAVLVSLLFIQILMFVLVRTVPRFAAWGEFRPWALAFAFAFLLSFAIFVLAGDELFGLAQRFQLLILTTWLVLLATKLSSTAAAPSDEEAPGNR